MVTNDTGYELQVGPDKAGRYLTVQSGDEYEPPQPPEQLQDPEPDRGGDEGPEATPPNAAAAGSTGQRAAAGPDDPSSKPAAETTTAPPATTPPTQTAEPTGDDQKAEITP